jgi:mannose-6-phosphate isomerase-like protein (cupin superfamily)
MVALGEGGEVKKVNLEAKFALFDELWAPRVVGELNGQLVKLAKVKGEFVWHRHEEEDEMFLVVRGALTMKLRDRTVELAEGEFFIVPRGVEHCPVAAEEAQILLFEPKSTAHTGKLRTELTVDDPEWLV